jgi:hypothetical protein
VLYLVVARLAFFARLVRVLVRARPTVALLVLIAYLVSQQGPPVLLDFFVPLPVCLLSLGRALQATFAPPVRLLPIRSHVSQEHFVLLVAARFP